MTKIKLAEPPPVNQVLSKNRLGELVDAVTGYVTYQNALRLVELRPYILTYRKALGLTVWWGTKQL
jgi:hypothetical protein